MENKSPLHAKDYSWGWHLDVRNSGTVRTIANLTAPRCTEKGVLHNGVNISVCENNTSGQFSQTRSHNYRCTHPSHSMFFTKRRI